MPDTDFSEIAENQHSQALMSDKDLIQRVFDHIDQKSTDMGEQTWQEPTINYQNPERLKAEVALMRSKWIVFCPSNALKLAGEFIARDVAGVPLVVVRGSDGKVRAFRNACRHRGVQVADGQGCSKMFVCPYHGWSYGLDGTLRGVPHLNGFPNLEKKKQGLVPVACAEKDNLILVNQEADQQNTEILSDLSAIVPDGYSVIRTETSEIAANWKLHLESTLEGYHIRTTHNQTFFPVQYDNLNIVEAFGQNTRVSFPYQAIEGLRNKPLENWSTNGRLTLVYHLFPNVIISTFPDCMLVVILEPLGLELTRQHTFLLAPDSLDAAALDAVITGQEFARAGAVEDQAVVLSAQRGLASGANKYLNFGLYESGIVRFHSALTEELGQ